MFSEALEQQEALRRFYRSGRGRSFLNVLLHVDYQPPSPKFPQGRMKRNYDNGNYVGSLMGVMNGTPYYVPAWMETILLTASASLPLDLVFHYEMVPEEYGFVWLEEPIQSIDTTSPLGKQAVNIYALSWAYQWRAQGGEPGEKIAPGVTLIENHPEGAPYGVTIGLHCDTPNKVFNVPVLTFAFSLVDNETSLAVLQREDPDESYLNVMKFALTFWSFLDQEIIEAPRETVAHRGARKNLRKLGLNEDSPIRVVKLRRVTKRADNQQERHDVAWQCQWMVSPYWRRQHTKDGRSHVFVHGHVKGDPTKPLKPPRKKVYAVVR